jgi:hypothetical protein
MSVDSYSGEPTSQQVDTNPTPDNAPVELSDDARYVVDGQVISGKDLRAQRMMQADYTRKTQGLSQERQNYEAASRLLSYLQENPQEALKELAQHYNVTGFNTSDTSRQQFQEDEPDPRMAELQQRVSRQEAFAEQQLQQEADRYIESRMQEVRQTAASLGLDQVDEEAVFQYAIANNLHDPKLAFYGLYENEIPQSAARKGVQEYSAKRGLPVNRGSLQGAPRGPENRPRARTMRQALEQALEDHEVDDLGTLPS